MVRVFLFIPLVLLLCGGPAEAALRDGLYLYAGFEHGAAPDYAIGAEELGVPGPHRLGPGRHGQCLVVDNSGQAQPAGFLTQTNLDNDQGTLSFFFCPDWDWTDQTIPLRFLSTMPGIDGGNGWLILRNQHNHLAFCTGYLDATGWHWEWSPTAPVPAHWKPGEWYHLAVTWDGRGGSFTRVLYLDGQECGRVTQQGVTAAVKSDRAVLTFGSESAPGRYDEVALWGRVLTAAEIARLASGEAVDEVRQAARELQARKPVDRFAAATVAFDEEDGAYGEKATVRARLSWSLKPEVAPVSAWWWWVEDLYGRPGKVTRVACPAPTRAVNEVPLAIHPDGRLGAFRIVVAVDARRQVRRDAGSFARLPERIGQQPCREDSFFGAHLWWEQPEFHCRLGRKIGVRWVRFHDTCNGTWWAHAEPQPGQWVWFDEYVDRYARHGFQMLGTLSFTPNWAAGHPENTTLFAFRHLPPTNLEAFANYVRRVVGHYKDRIHYWEVWNEPQHGGFWAGTAEEYGELLKVAYRAAKEVDPTCTIVGGGGLNFADLAWVDRMLSTGCLSSMDRLSIHYYYDEVRPRRPEDQTILQRAREMMAKHGRQVPIWNTEHAVYSASLLRELQRGLGQELQRHLPRAACADLIKALVVNQAQGIERFFYYAMRRNESWAARAANPFNQNLIDAGNTVHPLGVAYATAVDHLDGARFVAQAATDDSLGAYVFSRPGGAVAVLWRRDDRARPPLRLRLPAGASARVFDMMNNARALAGKAPVALRLGTEPLFLEVDRCPAAALQRALEAR